MKSFRIASLRLGTPKVLGVEDASASNKPDSNAHAIPGREGARSFESSILKASHQGPVAVGAEGLSGDAQADTRHHGGRDKAVCIYPADHYPLWAEELRAEGHHEAATLAAPGAVGENLTVEEVRESAIAIGDRLQGPSGVVLEVSQPRVPCWKVARRWGVPDMAERMIGTGRTGWYCRVLTAGSLAAGDALAWVAGSHPSWSVERANRVCYAVQAHAAEALELAEIPALSAATRATLYKKLNALGYVPLACAVHDLLEDAAVRRVAVEFELRDLDDRPERHTARVVDLRTERGAEYVELSSSRLVRLDRIVGVNPT